MAIPTRKENERLEPETAAFLKACHELKVAAPGLWGNFLNAYGDILDREQTKFNNEVDPKHLPKAQGRVNFATTLGQMMDTCTERLKKHVEIIQQIATEAARKNLRAP